MTCCDLIIIPHLSMALSLKLLHLPSLTFHGHHHASISNSSPFFNIIQLFPPSPSFSSLPLKQRPFQFQLCYRYSSDEGDNHEGDQSFDEAVALFNDMEYYRCHDSLEALWNRAEEPRRTLFHGILQCAVGFHHLLNQNHKGAMMELGEGLCKLRKMNFRNGPFHCFEQEISAALDFIYHTQIELAACSEDLCIAMDRSERSYQLLGAYAAGQHVYRLQADPDEATYIVFSPGTEVKGDPPKVKLPSLNATEENLPQI